MIQEEEHSGGPECHHIFHHCWASAESDPREAGQVFHPCQLQLASSTGGDAHDHREQSTDGLCVLQLITLCLQMATVDILLLGS